MTQNLINYEKDERYLGTILFKHFKNIDNYSFSNGRVCYDCSITMKDQTQILGEIKVRNFKIGKYPDYILQADKLVNLMKRAKKFNYNKIYYINFFTNDDINKKDFIVFNLTPRIKKWKTTRPEVKRMFCNAETHRSTSVKMQKDIILLKYDEKIDMMGTIPINGVH